jgi:hypothetical protein
MTADKASLYLHLPKGALAGVFGTSSQVSAASEYLVKHLAFEA